ncbi:hypothetical protein PFICI_01284 [Pestalotiopsis fici W106-1]|uniref:Heterokaryon incompatibility domain-containing protein n=1 Tax=Pestalotiopsis fici (strain W106-1 / CGMCC3.15140) TaxID=1229662 RepID=W3XQB7_PESFW|nr:uncharacterized protein PFICI_01284 [Pestalotiopsis fici W106-1]ETS87456.1 hypothetical protein PFICI_01284 [Pestalotiopsis fici W106-1]
MLCENCQQSALSDDSSAFRVETDEFGHSSAVTDEDSIIPTDYFLLDHFPELPKLRESGHGGCEFCSFIRESILSSDNVSRLQDPYGVRITSLSEEEVTLRVRYLWNYTIADTDIKRHFLQVIVKFVNIDIGFGIFCRIRAAEKGDPVAQWLRLDDSSTQAFTGAKTIGWIKERIHECTKHNHELPSPEFIPSLLLDVRGKSPKLTDHDTLISSRKTLGQLKVQTPRYTALSYCWGTAEDAKVQLKTTKSSFSKRQAGIEPHEITPVLQDAIIITKQLSIPYLWIDCLCIFQDDITDWDRQCAEMDKIYGHAEITIVAASSTSCREGFIQRRVPRIKLPFYSTLNRILHGSMWIELGFAGENLNLPLSDIYLDAAASRLATRGWTVQERLLSTRQIVFGKFNAHFICPWGYQSNGGPLTVGKWLNSIHSARTTSDVQELFRAWSRVLIEYRDIGEDSFTHATDLLPSLSGMAADFAKRLKDDYFAGHWGNDLIMGLMWSSDSGFKISKSVHLGRVCAPLQYVVPSWSQLFHSGLTNPPDANSLLQLFYPAVECIEARTSISGSNVFGTIKNGELRVRGHTLSPQATSVIQFKSAEPLFPPRSGQGNEWRFRFERSDGESLFCDVRLDFSLPIIEIHEEVKLWKWILLGTCKLGPFGKSRRLEKTGEDMHPFGLLVHSCRRSEWCRIGVFVPAWGSFQGSQLSLQTFQMASTLEDITII